MPSYSAIKIPKNKDSSANNNEDIAPFLSNEKAALKNGSQKESKYRLNSASSLSKIHQSRNLKIGGYPAGSERVSINNAKDMVMQTK